MREVITFSSLFPNAKDKMLQFLFSISSNMHFYNVLNFFKKIECVLELKHIFFKILASFRDQP